MWLHKALQNDIANQQIKTISTAQFGYQNISKIVIRFNDSVYKINETGFIAARWRLVIKFFSKVKFLQSLPSRHHISITCSQQ